ncbi:MAG: hypothetical protein ABJN36_17220 [Cyclobacteriaceae bacterium]
MDLKIPHILLLQGVALFFFFFAVFSDVAGQEKLNFEKADSVAHNLHGSELKNLKLLSDQLTNSLDTDMQKFRSIFRWVCDNLQNDYFLYRQNKTKREKWNNESEKLEAWNDKFSKKVIKRLFEDKTTVCTGYAYILKELCYHAELECEMIDGYGRSVEANIGGPGIPNHTWNAVKLQDKWYLCDATWSSGGIDGETKQFLPKFSESYFLTSPELFVMNHYPLDTNWLFIDRSLSLEEFLNAPLVYKGALSYSIRLLKPNVFESTIPKEEPLLVSFACLNDEYISRLRLEVVNGGSLTSATPEIIKKVNGEYYFKYDFRYRGDYILHLRDDDQYLVTFKVAVTR